MYNLIEQTTGEVHSWFFEDSEYGDAMFRQAHIIIGDEKTKHNKDFELVQTKEPSNETN
jgi:hypothetical protein